ncbi:hypothetical protein T265_03068 [Opisthorchis viverrini]|uniref:Uncharacterized protein n=1 Tax=Opisthorchis viverrini TaxID=6198 RepID=A0A074ZSQ3_OPIVI|nr:hypothetical protein T265_03068 [Opisthorchis viverrini]KER30453.1 hypothetical protein T265_03068 [Opisthorchis viverrini]
MCQFCPLQTYDTRRLIEFGSHFESLAQAGVVEVETEGFIFRKHDTRKLRDHQLRCFLYIQIMATPVPPRHTIVEVCVSVAEHMEVAKEQSTETQHDPQCNNLPADLVGRLGSASKHNGTAFSYNLRKK